MSDRTGILADTVTVSCIGCDCVLIVPARLSGRSEGEARKETARVTGETKRRDGGKGR